MSEESTETLNGADATVESKDEDDTEESGPAEDFGLLLGVPLALIALVLAFVGPVRILTLFRFDLPIVASFRSPIQYEYFAYIGAVFFRVRVGRCSHVPLVTER